MHVQIKQQTNTQVTTYKQGHTRRVKSRFQKELCQAHTLEKHYGTVPNSWCHDNAESCFVKLKQIMFQQKQTIATNMR